MDGAVVEFDALTDADRAGAEDDFVDDFEDVLLGQWFEVQGVGGIEVGGNGFRVVIDDDGFLPRLAQCPGGMSAMTSPVAFICLGIFRGRTGHCMAFAAFAATFAIG